MLLVLNDQQKEHLSLLTQIDADVAKEFCKIAVDFIKEGVNTKKCQLAAQKLNIQSDHIRQAIEAVMHILNESSKLEIDEMDFKDSLEGLELPEELCQFLLECYLINRTEIRSLLRSMSIALPKYTNLEWRFDVVISSRMLKQQTTPEILFKLFTQNNMGEIETKVLKTDPVNLQHMTLVLDEALRELKSSHCRRIAKNIK